MDIHVYFEDVLKCVYVCGNMGNMTNFMMFLWKSKEKNARDMIWKSL